MLVELHRGVLALCEGELSVVHGVGKYLREMIPAMVCRVRGLTREWTAKINQILWRERGQGKPIFPQPGLANHTGFMPRLLKKIVMEKRAPG